MRFNSCHKTDEKFEEFTWFGGCCLKIRDNCMDFEPYFKVHNLVSVHPKSTIIGQRNNLDMIFHVMVSVYWLVKIWNSPQFPAEFRNGLLLVYEIILLADVDFVKKLEIFTWSGKVLCNDTTVSCSL